MNASQLINQTSGNLFSQPVIPARPKGGARVSSGKNSEQEVGTPWDFINACNKRWGPISYDLAAGASNTKADRFFSKEQNSLVQQWHLIGGILWLNPEFSDIAPWAAKCAKESKMGAQILFLVPASVDSNWWSDSVHGRAMILPAHPRIKFIGSAQGYPKPIALCCYGIGTPGYPGRWIWK